MKRNRSKRLAGAVAFLSLLGAGLLPMVPAPAHGAGQEFDAAAFYKSKCLMCHTASAKKHFDPSKPDAELVKSILKGVKGGDGPAMPGYESKGVTEAQAKALVDHMRSVQQ